MTASNVVLVATHVLAGSAALLAGAVAMAATKGGRTHRRAGDVFAGAMAVMAVLGGAMAAAKPERASVLAALVSIYTVGTAFLAVRRDLAHPRRWLAAFTALGLAIGVGGSLLGVAALDHGGRLDGMPAPLFFIFASVALLGAAGDVRVLRKGPPVGAARLVRHVWRMGFAMFVATGSFFMGQADEFPTWLRIAPVMFGPVLLVIGHTLYWLVRLRLKRRDATALPSRADAPARDAIVTLTRSPQP